MKKTLFVMAAAMLVCLSACNPKVLTYYDYLQSATKGWVMTSVVSVPAYELADSGVSLNELFADGDYEHSTGFFTKAEKDDIIIFGANNVMTIDPGTELPDDGSAYQAVVTTTYSVDETEGLIYFQMPWEYNEDYTSFDAPQEKCSIQEISKDKLVIKYTRNDDENPAKAQNTFTITYVPVK